MVNLNLVPGTNAETHARMLLCRVAEIGKLYDELYYADIPRSDWAWLRYSCGEENAPALRAVKCVEDQFQEVFKANRNALKFVRDEFLNAIDEFNKACDAIKNDKRSRTKILEDEGWERTLDDDGDFCWKRCKCVVKA